MKCLFDYKRRNNFSFGIDPGFMDYVVECDDKAENAFNLKYPSCWDKFLNWLGLK